MPHIAQNRDDGLTLTERVLPFRLHIIGVVGMFPSDVDQFVAGMHRLADFL